MARKKVDTSGLNNLQSNNEEIENKVDSIVTATPTKPAKAKPFKKPNSDYYRLDLIVRGVADGKMNETIKTNYKDYLSVMTAVDGISITKYIQALIDNDMKNRNKEYTAAKKILKS